MKIKLSHSSLIILGLTVLSAGLFITQSLAVSKKKALPSIDYLEYDKGPATINVSAYPEKYQKYYRTFKAKCSLCHTLARSINAPYNSNSWKRTIKKMMRMPGANISSKKGKKIYLFMKYYSSKNK